MDRARALSSGLGSSTDQAEWSTDSLVVQATEAGAFTERLRLEEIAAGVWEALPLFDLVPPPRPTTL